MPRIVLEVGEGTDHVGFDHVFIKSTGWVKGYDDGDNAEPVFYPPHRVRRVVGDVTHNNTHGRV
jgi:hypothetical protein